MARPKDDDTISITFTFDEISMTIVQLENRVDFYLNAMKDYPEDDTAYRARANEISNIIEKITKTAGIQRIPRTNQGG